MLPQGTELRGIRQAQKEQAAKLDEQAAKLDEVMAQLASITAVLKIKPEKKQVDIPNIPAVHSLSDF
jgi:hypothetical protein